jgi:hypothetical protein
VSELRDYQQWHRAYDDPDSALSWRLRVVQDHLRRELDSRDGPVRILSACSGDGRDVIGVLRGRDDADRVRGTLVELHPAIAQTARGAADEAGLRTVEVRTADAGSTDAYVGAVPADVLLLVGIFGNVSDADIERTIRATPSLCSAGALVLWSRGRPDGLEDRTDAIRAWFAEAGFAELDYASRTDGIRPSIGAMRLVAPPQSFEPGRRLFTFVR